MDTIGISCVGFVDMKYCEHLFQPIILVDTPLPVYNTIRFFPVFDNQGMARVCIFQGESYDVRKNTPIGDLVITGLSEEPIPLTMALDREGKLQVRVKSGERKIIQLW